MKNPDVSVNELMEALLGLTFQQVGLSWVNQVSARLSKLVKPRLLLSRVEIEQIMTRERIVVTEIPGRKAKLVERIASALREKN